MKAGGGHVLGQLLLAQRGGQFIEQDAAGEWNVSGAQGATLKAGGTAVLDAENDVLLLAARNTAEQHSTNRSSSASVGVSYGSSGLLFTASASAARGRADGNDVTWTNTQVAGGERVVLRSGRDTTLQGAVVKAPTVQADVARDLNLESLQDTSTYTSRQRSAGGSVSAGAGQMGGSLSAG
ncbi:hemagglutinin repeat-containing protein, partial [Ramlibacter sp. AN1015]|uniref:hemagglutinin repeat-containing protein n=1 Tax=Ramlibacter sp. AN1015 TaxID=3133428 RepID=UPI0030C0B8F4